MQKKYKDFTIEKMAMGTYWVVKKNDVLVGMVYSEEEARRVVWLKSGEGEYITDDMMEVVND